MGWCWQGSSHPGASHIAPGMAVCWQFLPWDISVVSARDCTSVSLARPRFQFLPVPPGPKVSQRVRWPKCQPGHPSAILMVVPVTGTGCSGSRGQGEEQLPGQHRNYGKARYHSFLAVPPTGLKHRPATTTHSRSCCEMPTLQGPANARFREPLQAASLSYIYRALLISWPGLGSTSCSQLCTPESPGRKQCSQLAAALSTCQGAHATAAPSYAQSPSRLCHAPGQDVHRDGLGTARAM